MRYSIQTGLEPGLYNRVEDNVRYVAPLFVLLLVVLALGLSGKNSYHKAQKPMTLGIYTIKSNQPMSGKAGSGSSGQTGGAPQSSTQPSPVASPASSPTPSYSSPSPSTGTLSSPTGGLGGGSGTTSPTTSTSSPQTGSLSTTLQSPSVSTGIIDISGTSQTIDPGLPKPSL